MTLFALLVLIALLAVNAWLVTAGTAIRSVSRIWLRHWAHQDGHTVPAVKLYLSRPDQLLLAAGLGLTATTVLAGAILGGETSTPIGLVIALAVAGGIVLIVGQLIPRAIGRRWAKTLVPVVVPSLQAVAVLTAPLLWLARAARAGVERPRDVVKDVFRDAHREGVGRVEDVAIVSSVVKFGGRVVRDVMTPRADVFAIDATMPAALAAEAIARSAYSRVPVYRGSFDDVVGMVHTFDVLKAKPSDMLPLRPIARAAVDARLDDVMFAMLRDRVHMAVVADGAGRHVGIVTLEDLLETLVGEIEDEHDE
ncbi:MAG TPA: CNNM domain-containing protein [Gemmatimonadaceae bacterium]|nr:CNNM domain-containing protein [Gemmatimonadaceae bacterium]